MSVPAILHAAAEEFGVRPALLASLAWAESSFRPAAVSPAGAQGLCQIMPATWGEWAGRVGASDPFDARDNARVGSAYLAWLLRQLGNEWSALAAYNWGIGNVLAGREPPAQTTTYVRSVIYGANLLEAVAGAPEGG